jgi:hypothetical protein
MGDEVAAHPAPLGLSGVADDGNGHLTMSVESWIDNAAQDLPEARTTELKTSHMSRLSAPQAVADVIGEAVCAIAENEAG